MDTRKYDVLIVGAGPAGSTVATTIKNALPEAKILLIDKETFPRHKLGESILPGTFDVLKKLGVLDKVIAAGFPRKMGAYYFWGKSRDSGFLLPSNNIVRDENGKCTDTTPHMHSYHVERDKYDKILADFSQEKGVEVQYQTKVKKVEWDGNSITSVLLSDDSVVEAKYYVDATGIYSGFIPNEKKELTPLGDYFGNVAIHGYLKGAKFIHEFPGLDNYVATTVASHFNYSWSWYIPVDRDLVSVGIVFNTRYNTRYLEAEDKEKMLRDTLCEIPQMRDAIEGAEFVEHCGLKKISTVKNWNGFSKNVYGDNWFLAGDAAFFSDPILSTGVTMAHRGAFFLGILLKEALKNNNPEWVTLLKKTYQESCAEIYSQVKGIIEFWYEGMDDNYDMQDLFKQGDDVVQNFGLFNQGKIQSSFMYVVNGLLQSIDVDDDEDTKIYNGSYDQDDFERMIKGIAGQDIKIETSSISDNDIFAIGTQYKIEKKLRVKKNDLVLGYKLTVENNLKSSFFINDSIRNFLMNIDGKASLGDLYPKLGLDKPEYRESLKKEIRKLEILGLLKRPVLSKA